MSLKTKVAKLEQEAVERNVSRKLKRPEFINKIERLRLYVSQGYSLDEARRSLPRMSDRDWTLCLHALGMTSHTAGKLFTEFYVKAKTRIQMTIDTYNRAKKANDLRVEMTAIMTMIKIDESLLQWAQSLGIIMSDEKEIDGGLGIPDDQLKEDYARLEQRLISRLQDDERSRLALPASVLEEPKPTGERDQVGPTPMDVKTS